MSYEKVLPHIFSKNLVRCLINQLPENKERSLNGAAIKSMKVLAQTVEAHSEILPLVLPHLISGHGTYLFDRVTKTKTIDKLLGFVDQDNAKAVVESLVSPVWSIDGYVFLSPCSLDINQHATALNPKRWRNCKDRCVETIS